jgi:WD40 repeat protein
LGAPIVYLTFAPDPSLLVAADESGAFAVIDVVRQSTVVGPIRAYEGLAAAPAVARDRHELVAVHSDGTVTIWDLAPAPVLGPCAYSWDGRRIASLHDSAVFIWDAVGLQPVGAPLAWPGARPGAVAFVPDGSTLAVALDDRTVRLWDMNAATEGRALTGPGQSLPAEGGRWRVQSWQVGVAPSGQAIAAWVNFAGEGPGQWDEVWVWDPSSGAADLVTSSKGDLCGIGWIDGDTLLVARIGALRLWSVLRKELTWRGDFEEFEAVFAIGTAPAALTPTWTVSHENREVVVWTGSAVAGERYRIQGERVSPTISADGSRLVWAEGGSIVIWSLLLRSQVGGGLPYDAPLTACYFSPFDGALLVVSGGGRAERWTTEPEAVRRLVCSLAARAPNEEERSDFGGLDLDLECLESGENLIVPADWSRQDPIGTREARALKDCGLTLAERRLYKEALESLDRAAVLAPADAQVQHHRGVVLIALGSLVAAVHAFDRALALRPDLESTRTAQAHALAVLKGNEKASATSVGRRARRRPSLIPDARAGRRP